ncbi:MAG: phosphomannomutase [Candidatus Aenigmatarchaeota archaeon]
MIMEIDKNIFRAYDIRGIYGKNLTEGVMQKIGMAVGTMMIRRKMGDRIVLGRDTRASSESLLDSFIVGITSMGIDVMNVGATSFGVAMFSGWSAKAGVTSFVTASHKPPEWNGIKFYDNDNVGFFEKDNLEIGRLCLEEDFEKPAAKRGQVTKKSMDAEYVDHIKDKFSITRKLKVVIDCGNGCTSLVVPGLLRSFGCLEVVPLFCEIDPNFSGRGSDIEDGNLTQLKEVVLAKKADLGIALDGDGDRVGFVDEKGNILSTEATSVILGGDIIKKGDSVIANVETSMMFEEAVESLGGKVIHIPVGHTFMMRAVLDNKAVYGMEASKHIVIPKYFPFDDATVAALKVLEFLSGKDKPLSHFAAKVKSYPRERVRFECTDESKFKIIERLQKEFSQKYPLVNKLDGIRVDFEDGWILARASNTGPIIRLTIEARTPERLAELKRDFSEILDAEIKREVGICRQ